MPNAQKKTLPPHTASFATAPTAAAAACAVIRSAHGNDDAASQGTAAEAMQHIRNMGFNDTDISQLLEKFGGKVDWVVQVF